MLTFANVSSSNCRIWHMSAKWMVSREVWSLSMTDWENPACTEGKKMYKKMDMGHGPRVWLFVGSAFASASSLPRSSNPSRRAASTAQIYDARNSHGEIKVLQSSSRNTREVGPAHDTNPAEGDGMRKKERNGNGIWHDYAVRRRPRLANVKLIVAADWRDSRLNIISIEMLIIM